MARVGRYSARLRLLPPALWVGALVVVLVGLTAAFGGFAPAPDRGRPVEAGEQILLQRWRIHVDHAVLVDHSLDGQDPAPRIQLVVRTEFTGDQTLCCLTEGLLEVRYAGRVATRVMTPSSEPRSILGFDPGVEVTRTLEFPIDPVDLPTPAPRRVEVVVRDERPSRSLILEDWVLAAAVATVEMNCPDERARR